MAEFISKQSNKNVKHYVDRENLLRTTIMNNTLKDLLKLGIILVIALLVVIFIIRRENKLITRMNMVRHLRHVLGEEKDCLEQSHYKYPIIMWWHTSLSYSSLTQTDTCNYKTCTFIECSETENCLKIRPQAYIFTGPTLNLSDLPLPRKPSDIWVLSHDESPQNNIFSFSDVIMSLFNYSSTYSRHSDVPIPLMHLYFIENIVSLDYYVKTEDKNKLLDKLAPVLFVISDCDTSTEREKYVAELMKYIPIDSYGLCLQNKVMPQKLLRNGPAEFYSNNPYFLRFVARYKFTIAIENAVCNDYTTEKFWRPIRVGSVPIYFGSPTIRDWMPNNKSAILLTDYPTPELMAKYLKKLLANDTLYEEHLEHKTKRIISNPAILEEIKKKDYGEAFLKSDLYCFVCKKVHEVMNGKAVPRTIDRSHLQCPIPISALGLKVNPKSHWVIEALAVQSGKYDNLTFN